MSWVTRGQPTSEIGRQAIIDENYDAPTGEIIEVQQLMFMNYFTNEGDVVNTTWQALIDQGQTPIYCAAMKDIEGIHLIYQYKSAGAFPWAILLAVIGILAIFGIVWYITQAVYKILEQPGGSLILLLIATGIAVGSVAILYYLWKKRKE